MLSAAGYIKSVSSGTKFIASFVVDDVQRTIVGSITPGVSGFTCSTALLTYSDLTKLLGTHTYEGVVGTTTIKFAIANGPVIEGTLDEPVDPAVTVDGNSVWTIT